MQENIKLCPAGCDREMETHLDMGKDGKLLVCPRCGTVWLYCSEDESFTMYVPRKECLVDED